MGRAAREVGDWSLAASLARQMMEHDPGYAGSHFAMGLVAEHTNDIKTARAEFASALKLWDRADPQLSELRILRAKP
jgi:Tfp pilus assembly protein PilF